MLLAWAIIGLTLVGVGIIGCVVPILPGVQIAYLGLLIFHFMANRPFSSFMLFVWLGAVIAMFILDQLLPLLVLKKLGGSKAGLWGAWIGSFIGIFLGFFWVFLGSFLGAFIAEWWKCRDYRKSLKPACWSVIWIAVGGIIKIAVCLVLWWEIFSVVMPVF